MLDRAREKARRSDWPNVTLIQEDARSLSSQLLEERAGTGQVDGFICTLSFPVMREPQAVFEKAFAAADIRRPTWRLLEGRVSDLRVRHFLLGFIFVASGTQP